MIVNVTQEHIRRGERARCELCPIARALKEAYPDAIRVQVFPAYVMVRRHYGRTGAMNASMPAEGTEFITRFDAGLPVEPFSFELPLTL